MASTGFGFANPQPSPNDYDTFNPGDVAADSGIPLPPPAVEVIPAPWKTPPVMSLSDVLGASLVQQIQNSGQIVFHSVGDTGGVKEPSHQFAVADAMSNDLAGKTPKTGQPAFFYHLGDVVYFFGQERYYYDQFYDPYRDYNAPIFAIPGNHDSILYPAEPVKYSLQAFVENFCTQTTGKDPAAKGYARTTMTQPGVYFTLNAPFVKIIGLDSNAGETAGVISGGNAGTQQLTFLQQQLQAAASQREQKGASPFALIIAVHHPPFTLSSGHFPSPDMLAQIDAACQSASIWPDIVLSGHAHLYERYTRVMKADGRQIPYVVAGNGGYFNLTKPRVGQGGAPPKTGVAGNDGKGNALTLNAINASMYGFLRLTISPSSILCESLGVNESSGQTSLIDSFTVDLAKHVVGSGGAAAKTKGKAQSAKAKPAKRTAKPAKRKKGK